MGAHQALVPQHGALFATHPRAQVGTAAQHAAVDAHPRAEVGVVVHDRPLDRRVVADPDVPPEGAVPAEARPRADHTVVTDDRRSVDDHARVDFGPFAEPHPRAELEAADVHLDQLVEDVLVGLEIGLEGPDVLPVAVGHVPEQRLPGGQRGREGLAGEIHRLALGDEVEDLGFQDVDPGVDGVAEDLTPGRLLEEALDGPVLVGDDDAELQGIVHRLEGEGGHPPALAVEGNHLAQVDVGEHVPGDDQEGLTELVTGVAHRSSRAQRGRLGRVDHPDPELGAVPEIGPDGVGHEGHGDHDVLEPVLAEQIDHVLHHRDVGHGEHGLGLVGREGAQPGPLATRHDDRLHDAFPSLRARRPSARACRATGTYEAAATHARVRPMSPVIQATTRTGSCQLAVPSPRRNAG